MDRINELLALGIANLSADDLAELNTLLLAEFQAAEQAERTAEVVAQMAALLESVEAVAAEQNTRSEAQAALDVQAAEMAERVAAILNPVASDVPPADPEDPPADPDADPEVVAEVVAEAEAITENAPEPVTAAVRQIPAVPRRMRPRVTEPQPDVTITAAGDVPGHSAGMGMTLEGMGEAFAAKAHAMRHNTGSSAQIATIADARPRPFVQDAPEVITAAFDAYHERNRAYLSGGIQASGGLCAPGSPIYTFQFISVDDRPVKAALPNVDGRRGSVIHTAPATINTAASGIVVHTVAEDEANQTKPCYELVCPAPTTTQVDAIPLCITVGNFDKRTFPEHFDNVWRNANALHARIAERNILDKINTNSIAITDAQNLGAWRDLLESWGRVAAARRNFHRMAPDAPVRVLTSAWVRDMARADLLRQIPGDSTLAVADAELNAHLAAEHLVPIWALEGRTGSPNDFGAQLAGTANRWPATVESYLFHEDAHFMIDAGELDFGMEIRDSTLNAQNDVNAMFEIFEGTGYNGLWSYRITNTVCATGETAATVDVACTGS